MANDEIKKEAEENIINRILENRVTTVVTFVGIVVAVVFWVKAPQNALELRVALLEQKQMSDNDLVLKLQNIKDNDLHEIHLANERLESEVQDLAKQMAAMNAKLDQLKK